MSSLWIASMVLQWVVIAALCVVVLSLVRQLGIVFIRLNPSAALDTGDGPGPGTEIPAAEIELFPADTMTIGGMRDRVLLIASLSPDCSVCTSVARYLRALARQYDDELDVLVVVNGTPRVAREFAETHKLTHLPLALRQHVPTNFALPASTPFGLVLNEEGTVAARGTPNALEHLEEMVVAAQRGTAMEHDSTPARFGWGDALPPDPAHDLSSDDDRLVVHHQEGGTR